MAHYLAVEQKEKQDGTYEVSTFKKETRDDAEKAFHSILAVAATSEHLVHSASILNLEGKLLKSECYKHDPIPQEEDKDGEEE